MTHSIFLQKWAQALVFIGILRRSSGRIFPAEERGIDFKATLRPKFYQNQHKRIFQCHDLFKAQKGDATRSVHTIDTNFANRFQRTGSSGFSKANRTTAPSLTKSARRRNSSLLLQQNTQRAQKDIFRSIQQGPVQIDHLQNSDKNHQCSLADVFNPGAHFPATLASWFTNHP